MTTTDERTASPAEVGDVASPPASGRSWPLTPGSSLGQSLRPRHAGLCAIEFLVEVTIGFTGTLVCHIQTEDGAVDHRVAVRAGDLKNNRFARFAVPPLPVAAGAPIYVWLETDAPGLGVYTCGPVGAIGAWRDHAPVDTSLVYRAYAVAPDARWMDRQVIEHLLARQTDLTRELIATRYALQRLADEHTAIERRLQRLRDRLLPAAEDEPRG